MLTCWSSCRLFFFNFLLLILISIKCADVAVPPVFIFCCAVVVTRTLSLTPPALNLPSVNRFSEGFIFKPSLTNQAHAGDSEENKLKTCYRCRSPKETLYLRLLSCLKQQLTKSTTCGKSFISLEQNQSLINDLLGPNCSWARGTISYTKRVLLGMWGHFVQFGTNPGKWPKKSEWWDFKLDSCSFYHKSNMKICVWQNKDDSSESHHLLVEH